VRKIDQNWLKKGVRHQSGRIGPYGSCVEIKKKKLIVKRVIHTHLNKYSYVILLTLLSFYSKIKFTDL